MITIVDGNNILHSTYHVAKFRAKTNEQFIKAFLVRFQSFQKKYKNLHLVFDGKNNTEEQSKTLASYKADRGSLEPEVAKMFLATRNLLRYMGFKVIVEHGVEADQVIATLALQAYEAGDEALIISTDKDFNQLINSKIKVYDPRFDVLRDTKFVTNKYKVKPSQFAFYLTLHGDGIDGVSGLEGCGPVNAVKLVQKYGTFKNAVNQLSECSFELSRFEKMFVDQIEHVKKCYKVIKLKKLEQPIKISKGKHDPDKLKEYCKRKNLTYDYLFGHRKF